MLDTTLPKCRPEWPTSTLELGSALRALRAQRHSNNCAAAVIPLRRAVADVLPARPHSEGAGNLARSVPGSVSDARSPGGARAHGLRADVKQVDIIADRSGDGQHRSYVASHMSQRRQTDLAPSRDGSRHRHRSTMRLVCRRLGRSSTLQCRGSGFAA